MSWFDGISVEFDGFSEPKLFWKEFDGKLCDEFVDEGVEDWVDGVSVESFDGFSEAKFEVFSDLLLFTTNAGGGKVEAIGFVFDVTCVSSH